jgi:hypothetical protein
MQSAGGVRVYLRSQVGRSQPALPSFEPPLEDALSLAPDELLFAGELLLAEDELLAGVVLAAGAELLSLSEALDGLASSSLFFGGIPVDDLPRLSVT